MSQTVKHFRAFAGYVGDAVSGDLMAKEINDYANENKKNIVSISFNDFAHSNTSSALVVFEDK